MNVVFNLQICINYLFLINGKTHPLAIPKKN